LAISPPGPLSDEHRLDDFQCTSPDLTKWLINRARKNHREGASRCFVVCDDQQNVIGYYALAAGAVSHELAPGSVKRNMPDPIPVAVLGRLAVHTDWAGKGIGQGLLKDAVQRTLQTAQQMGIRVLLCHAIDEAAKAFYVKHGFIESSVDPMAVMLSMAHLNDELRAP
jgi:predicted N-acetyltransferase YhbS